MCGRFGYMEVNKEKIKKHFRLKKINYKLMPRYNIAPSQDVPVILNTAPDELTGVRWGLIPFWAKDEKIGYKMINARAETITEKPSFRAPFKSKRCLILATHFYEWKKEEDGKQPYCIRLKSQEPFALAGIWDLWEKGKEPLKTCSIITCAPNAMMDKIHDRMPVILSSDHYDAWLGETSKEDAQKLLKSYTAKEMEGFPISKMVNAPEHDGPDILEPIN